METEISKTIIDVLSLVDELKPLLIGVATITILAILKDEFRNFFKGVSFRLDVDFQEDDIVFLESRKAMITKIGLLKTKVLMLDTYTIRKFNNSNMEKLKLEKIIRRIKDEALSQ